MLNDGLSNAAQGIVLFGMKASVALPWIIGIGAALVVAVAAGKEWRKNHPTFDDLKKSAEEAQQKVDDLKSKIEENDKAIKEINDIKGNLSESERTRLEILENENARYREQLELLEKVASASQAKVKDEQLKRVTTRFKTFMEAEDRMVASSMDDFGNVYSYEKRTTGLGGLLNYIDDIKSARAEIEDLLPSIAGMDVDSDEFKELDASVEKAQQRIDDATSAISGIQTSLLEMRDAFVSAGNQELVSQIDALLDDIAKVTGISNESFDKFKSDIEDGPIKAFESLRKEADLTAGKVLEIASKFPDFAQWMQDNGWSPEDVVVYMNRMAEVATETAETGATSATFSAKSVLEKAKADMSDLSTAMSDAMSSTGMSTDSVDKVTALYGSLENFDARKLFQKTTSGIHMNTKELATLNDEYVRMQKLKMDTEIERLRKEYEDLGVAIKSSNGITAEEQYSLQQMAERHNALRDQIESAELLRSEYAALTSEYNQFLAAQSASDSRDQFENMAKSYDSVEKLINQGWVNDAEVNEYLDTIYGKHRTSDNVADFERLTAVIEGSTRSISDFMSLESGEITTDGLQAFLDTVHDVLGDDFVQVLDNGGYAFDFMGDKINVVADSLGVSVEFIQLLERSMQDAGFDVFFDSLLSDIDYVARTANESAENVKKIGLTDFEFNLNTQSVDELTPQLDEVLRLMGGITNENGEIDLSAPGAKDLLILFTDISNKIAALQTNAIDIPVSISDTEYAKSVKQINADIARLNSIKISKEATIKIGGNVDDLNAEEQEILNELANNPVVAELDVNTSSAEDAIESISAKKPVIEATLSTMATTNTNGAETLSGKILYSADTSKISNRDVPSLHGTAYYSAYVDRSSVPSSIYGGVVTYRIVDQNGRLLSLAGGTASSYRAYANGTAFAGGTVYGAKGIAFRSGDWGTKDSGVALGGELGAELVVRDGKWHLIGENSAEFFRYQKGDIIFNAAQTKQIFEKGKITNGQKRGDALVSGTAFDSGSGSFRRTTSSDIIGSISNIGQTSGGASGGVSLDSNKEKYDWIKVLLDRVERKIKTLSSAAESAFLRLKTRLGASRDAISEITKQIENQQKAYDRYMAEANSIEISSDLKALVRDGTIDITLYSKETANLIKQYSEWYEDAINCRDAIDGLHESLAKLYKDQFDNIKDDYEHQLDIVTQKIDLVNNDIALIQARGYMETTEHYAELAEMQKSNIATMRKELSDLDAAFKNAINSGEIEIYSDAYHEMANEIDKVKISIAEATVELQGYQNTMRNLEWNYFDFAQDRFSQLQKESDFLIDLLSNSPLFDDRGTINRDGEAVLGLHALNYNAYMAQADEYAKELQKIQSEIANDPYNSALINRRESLLSLQQKSIASAEEEKNAIKDLVKEGIDVELDSLKKLIDAYEDSLDSAKDLYDYQKKISSKSSDVASIQKQIAAYMNDTSDENRSRLQKLQTKLESAQEDLEEAEFDQYIKDQKKVLDDLYNEYEENLNSRFDDMDSFMSDMIAATNENASEISRTIREVSDDVGYRVTDTLKAIFANGEFASVSSYKDFSQTTPVNQMFGEIYNAIVSMLGLSGNIKAFASGGIADFTGLAKLDGTPSKPELVLGPRDTAAFLSLRDTLMHSTPYLSALDSDKLQYRDIINALGSRNSVIDSGLTFGDIVIQIDHVQDYNDLIRQMRKDSAFEDIIHSITDNVYLGGSKLRKYTTRI